VLYIEEYHYINRKSEDLEKQINIVKFYCKKNNLDIIKIYKDIGSGLNTNRKGLWRLIRDAKKGLFSIVVINFKERLTRFGYGYLKEYLGEFGVEIISVNKLEDKTPETELVEDLLAIIQSFSGKLYGMRSHKNSSLTVKAL